MCELFVKLLDCGMNICSCIKIEYSDTPSFLSTTSPLPLIPLPVPLHILFPLPQLSPPPPHLRPSPLLPRGMGHKLLYEENIGCCGGFISFLFLHHFDPNPLPLSQNNPNYVF